MPRRKKIKIKIKINAKNLLKVGYNILFVLVLIFALLVIASAIPFPQGLRMYIVNSGSMAPQIKSGDLIFSKKLDNYQVEEIITYVPKVKGEKIETITHRLIGEKDGNFITKGDANSSEDAETVTPRQIKGRYIFRLPLLGYLVSFARTTPGLILLIVIPGTIIIYEEIIKIRKEIQKIKRKKAKEKILTIKPKEAK